MTASSTLALAGPAELDVKEFARAVIETSPAYEAIKRTEEFTRALELVWAACPCRTREDLLEGWRYGVETRLDGLPPDPVEHVDVVLMAAEGWIESLARERTAAADRQASQDAIARRADAVEGEHRANARRARSKNLKALHAQIENLRAKQEALWVGEIDRIYTRIVRPARWAAEDAGMDLDTYTRRLTPQPTAAEVQTAGGRDEAIELRRVKIRALERSLRAAQADLKIATAEFEAIPIVEAYLAGQDQRTELERQAEALTAEIREVEE